MLVPGHEIAPVVELSQSLDLGGRRLSRGHRRARLQPRVDDRTVAGAAAQVTLQCIKHRVARHRPLGRLVQGEQAHDDPRRAEAALGAVVLDHGGLDGVQPAVRADQILDRDDVGAISLPGQ